jgi:hypothetical protein
MNSPVGVNPHGRDEKVKLLLNSSHLETQAVKPQHHHGDDDFGVIEDSLPEKHQAPLPGASNVKVVLRHFHRCCYRSSPLWFFCWRGL